MAGGLVEAWRPLFGPPGQRFLVMDVDTVFTGKVLEVRAQSDAPFFVDDERLSDADFKRLYYDWDKLAAIDPKVQSARTAFQRPASGSARRGSCRARRSTPGWSGPCRASFATRTCSWAATRA